MKEILEKLKKVGWVGGVAGKNGRYRKEAEKCGNRFWRNSECQKAGNHASEDASAVLEDKMENLNNVVQKGTKTVKAASDGLTNSWRKDPK